MKPLVSLGFVDFKNFVLSRKIATQILRFAEKTERNAELKPQNTQNTQKKNAGKRRYSQFRSIERVFDLFQPDQARGK